MARTMLIHVAGATEPQHFYLVAIDSAAQCGDIRKGVCVSYDSPDNGEMVWNADDLIAVADAVRAHRAKKPKRKRRGGKP